MKHYSLKNILSKNAHYNIIIGERSNGKTYSVLLHTLEQYIKYGHQLGLIRRWDEDLKGKRAASMYEALENNGEIKRLSGGKWTGVYYYSGRWYLYYVNDRGDRVIDENPCTWAFSLSSMEHDKSTSYPKIKYILFDEFLTRRGYLPDEFIIFMNVLSTILRLRNDVKIFMCGNTVNKYCPYFSEMGLSNIKNMKQGDIDVYQYGNSGLLVAVEFSASYAKSKPSNIYFAFDNPKLSMITGSGTIWEIAVYPHKPVKFKPKDIIFTFFIIFNGDILQCEIISITDMQFIFIHRKTTPLQSPHKDLIYSPDFSPRPNWRRKINKPVTRIENIINNFFINDKVFYQDNEIGEIVRNYLQWCIKNSSLH